MSLTPTLAFLLLSITPTSAIETALLNSPDLKMLSLQEKLIKNQITQYAILHDSPKFTQARLELQLCDMTLNKFRKKQEIMTKTYEAYTNLYASWKKLQMIKTNLKLLEALARIVKQNYQQGLTDELTFKSIYTSYKQQLLNYRAEETNLEVQQIKLSMLTKIPYYTLLPETELSAKVDIPPPSEVLPIIKKHYQIACITCKKKIWQQELYTLTQLSAPKIELYNTSLNLSIVSKLEDITIQNLSNSIQSLYRLIQALKQQLKSVDEMIKLAKEKANMKMEAFKNGLASEEEVINSSLEISKLYSNYLSLLVKLAKSKFSYQLYYKLTTTCISK